MRCHFSQLCILPAPGQQHGLSRHRGQVLSERLLGGPGVTDGITAGTSSLEAARVSHGVDNHWLLKAALAAESPSHFGMFGLNPRHPHSTFRISSLLEYRMPSACGHDIIELACRLVEDKSFKAEKNSMGFHPFSFHLYIICHVLTSA